MTIATRKRNGPLDLLEPRYTRQELFGGSREDDEGPRKVAEVGFVPHAPQGAFTAHEWAQLNRYGRALSDLVAGHREPTTEAQRAFVEFARFGMRGPASEFEQLWVKYMQVRRTPLTIELVPRTSWFANARQVLEESTWRRLARACYASASQRCQVCGGRGPYHPLECHEIWEYDDERLVQRLVGLTGLCPACHGVKHMGKAASEGFFEEAVYHLARVNGWTDIDASHYVQAQFELWGRRSAKVWEIDVLWLYENGVDPGEVLGRPTGEE